MSEKISTTRGRHAKPLPNPGLIIKATVQFLGMFMPETLARRVVSIVLIAIGTTNGRITEVMGLSDRSIWRLKSLFRIYQSRSFRPFSCQKCRKNLEVALLVLRFFLQFWRENCSKISRSLDPKQALRRYTSCARKMF